MPADKFDTRLIHGGSSPAKNGDGVMPAIELSTTFVREDPRDNQTYTYSRADNPNRRSLERRIASLENGFDAAAFSSGSAASMALFQSLPAQSHIIVTQDAYYGTVMLLNDLVTAMGHTVSASDTSDLTEVKRNWQKNTRLVWLETPSNPQMRVSDIAAIADLAHSNQAFLCCDNTLATSVLQQPIEHGADFSMHSTTKYIGGHSDVTGGVIITRDDHSLYRRIKEVQALAGATPSPFDCWLLQRSIATLGIRVRHQSRSAKIIAEFLSQHAAVDEVLYPGLQNHRQATLISKQMSGGGAILSFLLKGGESAALKAAAGTRIIKQATSLGGVESLIEHRRSVEGVTSVSPPQLLRLSTGLEDPDDLIMDLDQALG